MCTADLLMCLVYSSINVCDQNFSFGKTRRDGRSLSPVEVFKVEFSPAVCRHITDDTKPALFKLKRLWKDNYASPSIQRADSLKVKKVFAAFEAPFFQPRFASALIEAGWGQVFALQATLNFTCSPHALRWSRSIVDQRTGRIFVLEFHLW